MTTQQQALPIDVERVPKRSTSRVVRRITEADAYNGGFDALAFYVTALHAALDRAGVKPGESFYVARVPPPDRRSHLGDLSGPPGSRAGARRALLFVFALGPATASEATVLADSEGGWRRVSELVQGGHLVATGETREDVPGHPARVLAITDRGRAALVAS